MTAIEPPPVYSSLSDLDKAHSREEIKEKKPSLFLSPFTARVEPKKFAVYHITVSLTVLALAIIHTIYLTIKEHRSADSAQFFLILIYLPPVPFFLLALYGIKKNRANCVIPIAVYMILAYLVVFLPIIALFAYNAFAFFQGPEARAYAVFFSGVFFALAIFPLLYTSHAARLYLRVRYDINNEKRNRNDGIKLPLV